MKNREEIQDLDFAMQTCRVLSLGVLHVHNKGGRQIYTLRTPVRTHNFRTVKRLTNYCFNAIEAVPCILQGRPDTRAAYVEAKMRRARMAGKQSVTLVSCMN